MEKIEEKRIFMTDNPAIHLMTIGVEAVLRALYERRNCITEILALTVLIPKSFMIKNNIDKGLVERDNIYNKRKQELINEYNGEAYKKLSAGHINELISNELNLINNETGLYLIGEVNNILNELKTEEKVNELLEEKAKTTDGFGI